MSTRKNRPLEFIVNRGAESGVTLRPHLYEDGKYVASRTRFKRDYVRVESERELRILARHGFRIRMSNLSSAKHRSPSLVSLQVSRRTGRRSLEPAG